MRMLEPTEILRFAEGCADFAPDVEKEILAQIASSPDLRRRVAELRRDLYLVECQIPEYEIAPEFLLEVNKLAEVWLGMRLKRGPRASRPLLGRAFFAWAILGATLLLVGFFALLVY